ncbi:MAG: hypothetical protein AAF004_09500 [Pseudomonadota bacterium]
MIDDETLTLYFYNETLTNHQRQEVEHALAHNSAVAAAYAALKQDLHALRDQPVVRAPEHLKYQWHAAIDQAAQQTPRAPQRSRWFTFAMGSAVVASVLAAFAIGTQYAATPDAERTRQTGVPLAAADADHSAFARSLQIHVQSAAYDLSELPDQTSDDQSTLVNDIVAQNRMFERAAETRDAPEIARLMRAIEPVLLRLADKDITPQEADALRMQLAFELNAMLTKLESSTSEALTTI